MSDNNHFPVWAILASIPGMAVIFLGLFGFAISLKLLLKL